MFTKNTITLLKKEDFEKYIQGLTSSSTLEPDTFTYDNNTRTITVNKVQTNSSVGLRIPIPSLYKGDIINLELEYKHISGDNASFLLYINRKVVSIMKADTEVGEWEKINIKFILSADTKEDYDATYIEFGGYTSANIGSYAMRNVSYSVESRGNNVYIVESGKNDKGSWIKYSDGYMQCFGTKKFSNIAVTKQISGTTNYYAPSSLTPLGEFPQPFTSKPTFVMTCEVDGGGYALASCVTKATSTELPEINTFSFSSQTLTSVYYNWYAFGKYIKSATL